MVAELVPDKAEQDVLFRALDGVPAIKDKAEWCTKWITDGKSDFATRLVAFALVEGIFFSSSFAAIFWIRAKGVMPGLTSSNVLISRDEGLHTSFACLLYELIGRPVPADVVYGMVEDAVNLEIQFFRGSSADCHWNAC